MYLYLVSISISISLLSLSLYLYVSIYQCKHSIYQVFVCHENILKFYAENKSFFHICLCYVLFHEMFMLLLFPYSTSMVFLSISISSLYNKLLKLWM